jgi:hypothetical protein
MLRDIEIRGWRLSRKNVSENVIDVALMAFVVSLGMTLEKLSECDRALVACDFPHLDKWRVI